jgi:heme-degrading monooxygenase HmoA
VADPDAEVVLLTAWHLRRLRDMPAAFLEARALERQCRLAEGCRWVHRWTSKRSLLLTSRWATAAAAEAWIRGPVFRGADLRLRARAGARGWWEVLESRQHG